MCHQGSVSSFNDHIDRFFSTTIYPWSCLSGLITRIVCCWKHIAGITFSPSDRTSKTFSQSVNKEIISPLHRNRRVRRKTFEVINIKTKVQNCIFLRPPLYIQKQCLHYLSFLVKQLNMNHPQGVSEWMINRIIFPIKPRVWNQILSTLDFFLRTKWGNVIIHCHQIWKKYCSDKLLHLFMSL